MKERIEVLSFKYKVIYGVFFFFLVISMLSPLSGEDLKYANMFKENLSLFEFIDKYGLNYYIISFLTANKIFFNIILSLLLGYFTYITCNMMGLVKNKYYYLVPFIMLLLVSTNTFSYNYMAISKTVTYTFPSIFVFIYFYFSLKKEGTFFTDIILRFLIIIYISFSSIFISIPFLISNIFLSTYLWKNKVLRKIDILFVFVLFMLTTFAYFLTDNTLYTDLSYTTQNITNYIDNFFSKNILLVILSCIPINLYLSEKLSKNIHKRTIIMIFDLIMLFSLLYNFSYYVPVNINLVINKYFGVFALENWYYIFYYIIYFGLLIISLNHYLNNSKNKHFIMLTVIICICEFPLSLLYPSWDIGVSIIYVLILVILISLIFKDLEIKLFKKTIICILLILTCYYSLSFLIIKYVDYSREEYIKEQINANMDEIEVKASPLYFVWRYNPVSVFSEEDFKKYYGISDEKKIKVKYFGVFKEIEKKVKSLI